MTHFSLKRKSKKKKNQENVIFKKILFHNTSYKIKNETTEIYSLPHCAKPALYLTGIGEVYPSGVFDSLLEQLLPQFPFLEALDLNKSNKFLLKSDYV